MRYSERLLWFLSANSLDATIAAAAAALFPGSDQVREFPLASLIKAQAELEVPTAEWYAEFACLLVLVWSADWHSAVIQRVVFRSELLAGSEWHAIAS